MRALRFFLKLVGLGFLTGVLFGTRLTFGAKGDKARAEVAKRLRELADRLERGEDAEQKEDDEDEEEEA
jgi:hypothetical protein